jgi:hypothetical protein
VPPFLAVADPADGRARVGALARALKPSPAAAAS